MESLFESQVLSGVGLVLRLVRDRVARFNGLGSGEIKRHPEVEMLLVTGTNRAELMKKVLNRPMEGVN
jgi:hypothetical protein